MTFGIHAKLDDLQRDFPPHRPLLLGHVHHRHAALPDALEQLVASDHNAGVFGRTRLIKRRGGLQPQGLQKAIFDSTGFQQRADTLQQFGTAGAGFLQVRLALVIRLQLVGEDKDFAFVLIRNAQRNSPCALLGNAHFTSQIPQRKTPGAAKAVWSDWMRGQVTDRGRCRWPDATSPGRKPNRRPPYYGKYPEPRLLACPSARQRI